jgi:chemotaxis protein MotB
MAEEDGKSPIIIKRIKKGGAAAHGGAWKVAYADFVTAMMAFFLLLWLLNSVTEEQLQGISNYFAPTAVSQSPSGAGGMLGGQVIGEGASQSNAGQPTATINLPPSTIGSGGQDFTDPQEGMSDKDEEGAGESDSDGRAAAEKAAEEAQLKQTEQALQQAMGSLPDMQKLNTSLLVDNTPEGMRIQIVDQDGLPMFPPGSSAMYEHTRKLLELVGRVIKQLPQKIAISGHTDGGGFTDPSGYGNWELSADRALASRRILLQAGVSDDRIARVSGRAAADPLLVDDPDSPRNRRISIILLRDPTTNGDETPRPLEPPPIPSVIRGE